MAWLKWHVGSATDPKFRLIAKKAGVNVAAALGVWLMLLERAKEDNGDFAGFEADVADINLGIRDGKTAVIMEIMRERGMIDGTRICAWEARQGQPEQQDRKHVASSTERSRQCRARKNVCNVAATPCNANATDATALRIDKNRIDKIKNIKIPPILPQGGLEGEKEKIPEILSEPEKSPERQEDTLQDEPGIEFAELRDFYTREIRPEGPLDGFRAYKALKHARDRTGMSRYPGNQLLMDDLLKRMEANVWSKGYAISLDRYLRTRAWDAPVVPRASPGGMKSFVEREEERRQKMFEDARLYDESKKRDKAKEAGL